MQERIVPDAAKQDTIFDSRPAYQFCFLMESTILNYLAFALKSDRFNDDMDSVRDHLQRLKFAAKNAQQLVQKYEENRVISQKLLLSKSRSDTALKKSRQAEEKLKELQNEFNAVQKDLKRQEESLKETITMVEENEEYQERQRNLKHLDSLTNDKNSLAHRQQEILEKKNKNKFFSFLSDNNADMNELTYVEAQQRKVDMQIRLLNREMARHKNKFEYLPKRKIELEQIQEKFKNNDETYKKKLQAAQAEFDMAEAKLYMESMEYGLVNLEISFALLRSYIRFMEMNTSIESAYNAMITANKTYLHNNPETFKDPLTRIKGLHKLIDKSAERISTMAALVRCQDLEEKDILELYEAYKSMPVYLRKKFMDEPAALDFHSIFTLCLSDLPKKEANPPRSGAVSTLFSQAKEQNRNSVNEQSLASSAKLR